MREISLLLVVAVLCCVALIKPRVGLLAYVWFALMRPDVLAYASGKYQYSLYLAIFTLLGSLRFIGSASRVLLSPISILLMLLQALFVVSAVNALEPDLSWTPLTLQTHVVGMALLQVILIQAADQLRDLLLVMGLSLGAVATRFGLFALFHGGVVFTEGYAGFLEDNNNLALAMVMTVGLCWHLRALLRSNWAQATVVAVCSLAIVTVIMTHSRGGLLSLLVVLVLIALRSRRKLAVVTLLATMTCGAIFLVRDSYLQRMETLRAPMEEDSARSRITFAGAGLRIARDYPWLGVGFGSENERKIIGQYLGEDGAESLYLHNTYLQVLVDSGVFAACIYVALLGGTILWLGRSAASMREVAPQWEPIPLALRAALAGYAVGSYFLSRVTFDFTYMLLMAGAAWMIIAAQIRVSSHCDSEDQCIEMEVATS